MAGEGLLISLDADTKDRLLTTITRLSKSGSRLDFDHLDNVRLDEADEIVELPWRHTSFARPSPASLVRDPDDNRVLEAAIAASADVIVTGDTDLLDLQAVEGIEIVRAADFLDEINA